jgi:hypothetical protein
LKYMQNKLKKDKNGNSYTFFLLLTKLPEVSFIS